MVNEETNKKLEDLLDRNRSIFDEFVKSVPNVKLERWSKTFEEKNEYEESIKDKPFSFMPKEVLENLGFRPFYDYGDLIVDCVNKMATNEKRKEFGFKEQETSNQNQWLERVKDLKDGDVWISLVESLKWCVAYTHEERIKEIRNTSQEKK